MNCLSEIVVRFSRNDENIKHQRISNTLATF